MQPVALTKRDFSSNYALAIPVNTIKTFTSVYDLVAHYITNRNLSVNYDQFAAQVTLSSHAFNYDLLAPTVTTRHFVANYDLNIPVPTTKLMGITYDSLAPVISARLASFDYTNNPDQSNIQLTLRQLQVTAKGVAGNGALFNLKLLPLTLQTRPGAMASLNIGLGVTATDVAGVDSAVSLVFPNLTLSAVGGDRVSLSIGLGIAASGDTVVDGKASLSLQQITAVITSLTKGEGRSVLSTLPLTIIANGIAGGTAKASLSIGVSVTVQADVGRLDGLSVALPAITINAAGFVDVVAVANLILPALRLGILGRNADGSGTFTGWALNIENNALTEYTGWAFNSLTDFNGVTLAANANGIFKIAGKTDNGAFIQSDAVTGQTDFDSPKMKRVREAFIGMRSDGAVSIKTITDEATVRTYSHTRVVAGIHEQRVKLSRGLKSRYWQFGISNIAGSDFQLDSLEVEPFELERRVR